MQQEIPLEHHLRQRFDVRVEEFSHRDFSVEMLLPRSADELIDTSEFNLDERLPYWAELWPSARALTRLLLEDSLPHGRVIELGCGVALPSLALRARGAEVLATDYYPEALDFARANAERNELAPLPTALLDWREPSPDLGRFDLVLAADVVYERRNAEMLAQLLPRITASTGRVLLADPGRAYFGGLRAALEDTGWRTFDVCTREEPGSGELPRTIRVQLLELSPPPTTQRS